MTANPQPPPQEPKATLAYSVFAIAIWGLIAYSLWGPKPPPQPDRMRVSALDCPR